MIHSCLNCTAPTADPFYRIHRVPVHSVLLLETRAEAVNFPVGDMELVFCERCGFIFNRLFDPSLHRYSEKYEETQGFSPTFNAFHRRLAQDLVDRHDLHGKEIIEIGCGKGEFLNLLCELGDNRGIGFDPAYIPERNRSLAKNNATFIRDFYSEKYTHHHGDFVACKMTLEHIPDTAEFVGMVRRSIGDRPDTVVFFQVPDVRRVLDEPAFWDIYYEHCSYFSLGSLAQVFRQNNFDILRLERAYDDQYLMLEAKPVNAPTTASLPQEDDLAAVKKSVANFTAKIDTELARWRKRVTDAAAEGKKIVIWGAGSKGVAFLTTLHITDAIEYAVDINPHKHRHFMAGTGQEIVSPDFLRGYRPDIILVMNPIYTDEIRRDARALGLDAELLPVGKV